MTQTIGVLLMAYGGPSSLDDLPGYLADIRTGRPTSKDVVDELTRNYAAIGGRSPINQHTSKQAAAVATILSRLQHTAPSPVSYKVYTGMRHWSPWIEETVGQMLDDGIERAVSLVLAPHYSQMSIAGYQQRITDGLHSYRGHIDFAHVDSYYNAPGLIGSLAKRVLKGMDKWPESVREAIHVVFSAHSLPQRIIDAGDPYDTQVRETARLVAEQAGIPEGRWSWSYQSAGRSPEPWLGPTLEEHLVSLADAGIRNVVSVPVGFVSDHVEILYDIDVAARTVAHGLGMRLERPPSLNDDTEFMRQLAALIHERAAQAGWHSGSNATTS